MPLGALSSATSSIARSYDAAQKQMAEALARLGSQRRFQTASQDSTAYMQMNDMQTQRATYDGALASIQRGQGYVEVADGWVTSMLDQLAQAKAAYNSGDTVKGDGIAASIAAGASVTYGGTALNTAGSFDTVRMADGTTLGLTGTAVTLNAITGAADVDTAIASLETYASALNGYKGQLDSQASFLSDMIENTRSAESSLTAIDEASEMAKYTEQDIKQQASLAMLSQGNMSKRSILALFM